jgi:hypothetical protein
MRATKPRRTSASTRIPPCVSCGARKASPLDEGCLECGGRICPECRDKVRQCKKCEDYVCAKCEPKAFTFECPHCGLGHHDECRIWLACSQCEEFACENCNDGEPFELCESCDGASVCISCAHETIGDETFSAGACPRCDIFKPAASKISEWKESGKITEEAVKAAARLWNKAVPLNILGFSDNENVRDDALNLLGAAATGSRRTRKYVERELDGLHSNLELNLTLLIALNDERPLPRNKGGVFAAALKKAKRRRASLR